jgi:hypothetical protein
MSQLFTFVGVAIWIFHLTVSQLFSISLFLFRCLLVNRGCSYLAMVSFVLGRASLGFHEFYELLLSHLETRFQCTHIARASSDRLFMLFHLRLRLTKLSSHTLAALTVPFALSILLAQLSRGAACRTYPIVQRHPQKGMPPRPPVDMYKLSFLFPCY